MEKLFSASPKPFVFVLMPFDEAYEDIYKVGIKPACKDAGAYCERVDEQIFTESILERIYNQLAKADIVVSDMSGRNPNVFYETGYAHALGKQVILLTKDSEDIPFDLKHYPHIVYEGRIAYLKEELERRVRWCIENPLKRLSVSEVSLQFWFYGRDLSFDPRVEHKLAVDEAERVIFDFQFDIFNPSSRALETSSVDLALIVPAALKDLGEHETEWLGERLVGGSLTIPVEKLRETRRPNIPVILPDCKFMYSLPKISRLLPQQWESVHLKMCLSYKLVAANDFGCILRSYSELGTADYPFSVKFERL